MIPLQVTLYRGVKVGESPGVADARLAGRLVPREGAHEIPVHKQPAALAAPLGSAFVPRDLNGVGERARPDKARRLAGGHFLDGARRMVERRRGRGKGQRRGAPA